MTWKVEKSFFDRKDRMFQYSAGDLYPRPGFIPTEKRIAELSSTKNRQGIPLISKVEETEPAKKPARRTKHG